MERKEKINKKHPTSFKKLYGNFIVVPIFHTFPPKLPLENAFPKFFRDGQKIHSRQNQGPYCRWTRGAFFGIQIASHLKINYPSKGMN